MPKVRKLSHDEVWDLEKKNKGQRKMVEEEYDRFLSDYSIGEYGEAELEENENRITVRNRLKAAATRRGLALDFKRTKGNMLRFRVVAGQEAETVGEPEVNEPEEQQPPPEEQSPAPTAAKARGRGRKKANPS